jgi:hypothetical protein
MHNGEPSTGFETCLQVQASGRDGGCHGGD